MDFSALKEFCEWDTARYFIISGNVFGRLIYYSHLLPAITCIVLALFVFIKNRKNLANKLLLIISFSFTLWSLFDLVLWATEKPDYTIFFWSLLIYLEPIIYAATFYLIYVIVKDEDLSFKTKFLCSLLFIPIFIIAPTSYNLLGYDFTNCDREAIEGPLWIYTYVVELFFVFSIVVTCIRQFKKSDKPNRKKIFIAGLGSLLFLLILSWGNITGSLSIDWELGQYGLLGMPIFIGLLAYLVVKYKTFNAQLIGTQALVAILWISLCAVLFVRNIENVRVVVSLTLILFLVVGILLVRSVKREVEQRKKIEKLAGDLEIANAKLKELDQMKSEFLSLATHQIRAPLTAIKGYSSMLLEGDFGVLPQKAHDSIETIFKSCQNLINIVGDFLNISRIEQGRMVYEKSIFNIVELAREVAKELAPNIQKAGLTLETEIKEGLNIKVNADFGKIKQVIGNILDNAIKYTLKGSIKISIDSDNKNAYIKIKDSGVGIDPKEIDKLFAKFTRAKDANKTNVIGTGLGLYIAKKMTEAHHGDIKIESEGVGKGTTFIIQIPKIISS